MRIRFADGEDGRAIAEIYAPYVRDTTISFEETPPDAAELRRRIEQHWPALPWLVLEHEGRVRGYAHAGPHRARAAYRWNVEVGIYVDADRHGRGVGRQLYEALFRVLRAQNFINAYAGVTLPNDPSMRFHLAMGFETVGTYRGVGFKHGAWRDVTWMALELAPRAGAPREPVAVTALPEREALLEAPLKAEANP